MIIFFFRWTTLWLRNVFCTPSIFHFGSVFVIISKTIQTFTWCWHSNKAAKCLRICVRPRSFLKSKPDSTVPKWATDHYRKSKNSHHYSASSPGLFHSEFPGHLGLWVFARIGDSVSRPQAREHALVAGRVCFKNNPKFNIIRNHKNERLSATIVPL